VKIITFSSLYPNTAQPRHGIFVEERLKNLLHTGEVEARVVAPVPWFSFTGARFGHYAEMASVPRSQTRIGLTVEYPQRAETRAHAETLGWEPTINGLLSVIRDAGKGCSN